MEKIQDYLKPRKNQKIQQGQYNPKNPHKYVGDLSKIYYRSSWELKFLRHCDMSNDVVRYSSEAVMIPYTSPIDKRVHRYYVDFYVEIGRPDGVVSKWLLEVKPEKHTKLPKRPIKESVKSLENYVKQVKRVLTNQAKFKAAKNFARQTGTKFGVVSLDLKTNKFELVEWEENLVK
jgi:hypothetical protein